MHRITVEPTPRGLVIEASGEVDAFAAGDLEVAFASAADHARLVVDLSRVSFLDSTALGVVVRAMRAFDADGTARIVLPHGAARRIFELTTLDKVLPVAPSRAAALADAERP